MKAGDKYICTENYSNLLTKGKVYTVVEDCDTWVRVINDLGNLGGYRHILKPCKKN